MRMFSACFGGMILVLAGCDGVLKGASPIATNDTQEQVERLLAAGEYNSCLSRIETWHRDIQSNPSRRLSAWEIDFMGLTVDHALIGKDHVYFTYASANSKFDAPGMRTNLPRVDPSRSSSWRHTVVCLDVRNGNILWSRPYGGLSRPAVDPQSDTLYLIGNDAIIGLPPDGSDPIEHPLTQKELVVGLLTKQGFRVSAPHGLGSEWYRDFVYLYSTTTKSLVKLRLRDSATLSPDESKRLVLSSRHHFGFDNHFSCQTTDGKWLWSFSVEGLCSACTPKFYKGDVIWMPGSKKQMGQVFRLNGWTGEIAWRTVLPNGAYTPNNNQLRNGNYAWNDWDALIPLCDGRRLLAIDGTGRLFFLDDTTGNILSSARPVETHLCAPSEVGENMVFCSYKGIRAVPSAVLLPNPKQEEDERNVLVYKAQCLAKLGRMKEAMSVLDYVLVRDEDCAEAWRIRAEISSQQDDRFEQSYCLSRYAQLTGKEELPELRKRFGLLRLISLASRPTWRMVDSGGREVYVGTLRGELWAIWPDSLETRVIQRRNKEITGLSHSLVLSFCASTGGQVTESPAGKNSSEPPDAPEAWLCVSGNAGPVVFYRGKYYRPLGGGKVRVLDGKNVKEWSSPLETIQTWRVHFLPSGPIGYGTGGVYELDEHLCPRRLLLPPRVTGQTIQTSHVLLLRNTGDSVGMVVATDKGAYLQVYGTADWKKRNEVYLGRCCSGQCNPSQFLAMGDGYLFSDRQLIWVSGQRDKKLWAFGPPLYRTETNKWGDRWRYFGDPLIRDGKVLVTAIGGCLYAFDEAQIIKTNSSRSSNCINRGTPLIGGHTLVSPGQP